MGGNNQRCNKVDLTPEEHYIAHLLLTKIHPTNNKLLYAAHVMTNTKSNKKYGWLKRKVALAMSQERKGKLNKGRKHSEETKQKISNSLKGHEGWSKGKKQ